MLHIKVEKNGINRKLSVMNIQKATFFMTNQMHMDMLQNVKATFTVILMHGRTISFIQFLMPKPNSEA